MSIQDNSKLMAKTRMCGIQRRCKKYVQPLAAGSGEPTIGRSSELMQLAVLVWQDFLLTGQSWTGCFMFLRDKLIKDRCN